VLAVAMFAIAITVNAQTGGAAAPGAKTIKNPVASTPASITAGAAAYKKYCAFCHGVTGKGDGPLAPKDAKPADLTDATWDRGATDGDIFSVIQNGGGAGSKMVAFKGKLPDQDMWHVVNFLRSLGPKNAPR
jgi:mono/diheme cytochrome c family protein